MADSSARPANSMKIPQAPRAAPPASGSPYVGLPTGRVLGVRRCPHCGLQTAEPVAVCPECGEALQAKAKLIRCRQCGGRALSSLALCPECGRELRAAPPRWLTWGAPAVVVLLFLAVLVARWDGGNPVRWAAGSLRAGLSLFGNLDDQMEPSVVVMTPVVAEEANPTAQPMPETAAAAVVAVEGPSSAPVEATQPPAAERQVAVPVPTDTAQPASTATQATAPATPTPAPPATEPPSVTATAVGLAALLPTATPGGDAPTETAKAIPAPPLSSRSSLVSAIVSASQPTPVAPTATATPTVTPTATPAATATPTPSPVTYEIRRGDTLVVIAGRFDVSVDELMAANNLAAADVFTIQPGQTLLIPSPAGTNSATPTSTPTATATPVSTPTPSPTAGVAAPSPTATLAWRLDAPVLRSPESGAQVSCSASDSLVWLPVPQIGPTDLYVMHLGYVNGRAADGSEQIVWILEQPRPANATSWEMDGDALCGLAPQAFGHQWRWYVEVAAQADGKLTPVSPPSDTWGFAWN